MNHRHLFPNEIDLLVDGEVGFGVAPLRAHLRECAECSAELERASNFAEQLDSLPHLSPSPLFASRVMSQVRVFEPWHVAALDSVKRWVPAASPVRTLAVASASTAGAVLLLATVWIAVNLESFMFLTQVGVERARAAALGWLGNGIAAVLGEPAVGALRESGSPGIAVAFVIGLMTALLTLLVLRGLSMRRSGVRR